MLRNYFTLLIVHLCLNCLTSYGQSSPCLQLVSPYTIAPSCNINNGIIRLSTKMIQPKFLWSDGSTDSIRINLGVGNYSVVITDSAGCSVSLNYNLKNTGALTQADFKFTPLNGLLKFEGNSAANSESVWDFGDGKADNGSLSYHQFDSVKVYNVTYTLKQTCGNTKITKPISVSEVQKPNYREFGFKNLPSGFIGTPENKSCRCGEKSFVRSPYLPGSNDYRVYVFDETNDTPALLPVIGGYSKFDGDLSISNKFFCYKNRYYFSAKNESGRYVLYKTDGTAQGTTALTYSDPRSANNPYSFFIQNDTLFFRGHFITEGVTGSDYFFKTAGNTIELIGEYGYKQILPFNDRFISTSNYGNNLQVNLHEHINKRPTVLFDYRPNFTESGIIIVGVVNHYTLFLGNTGANGAELWRTDGTVQGTQLVKDINPGVSGIRIGSYFIKDGILLFTAAPVNSYTYNLWRSDGTSEGTYILTETGTSKNITGSSSFISFHSKVYFIGTVDGATYLMKTNSTLQETLREKNPANGNFVFASTGPNNANVLVKDSLFLYYINEYDPSYAITCRTDGNGKFESIDKAKDCIQPGIFFEDGHNRVYTMVYRESPNSNLLRVLKDYSAATINDVAGFYGDSLTAEYQGNLKIRWFDTNKPMCDTLPSKTGNRFTFRNYFPLSSSAIRYTSENNEGAKSLKANLKIYNIPNEITIISVQRCNQFLNITYRSPKVFPRTNKFLISFYKGNTFLNQVEAEKTSDNSLSVGLNPSANQFILETTIPSQTSYIIGIAAINNSYKAEVFTDKQAVTLGDSIKVTALFYGTPPFHLYLEDQKYENIQRYLFEVYVKPTKNHTYNLTDFGGACGSGISTALRSTVVVSPPCAQNYIHAGVILPMNYQSSDLIKSSGTVSTSAMTGYQSNSIELLPGFLADKGAIFQAKTGGCN
ncbi:MAG: hypothetical protein U0X91_03100 [Spirosomataceae bacterium]